MKAKIKTHNPVTNNTLREIYKYYFLLLDDFKIDMSIEEGAQVFSDKRTNLLSELSESEATVLKDALEELYELETDMINCKLSIYGFAFKMGMIYGESDDDIDMNWAKIDMFLCKSGIYKKKLNDMDDGELTGTLFQFEDMYNAWLKGNKKAIK